MIELDEIFNSSLINSQNVFAQWFSGYLLLKSSPVKMWYDSPYGDEKYYTIIFQEYTIINIQDGNVVEEKSYTQDDFWKITSAISKYNYLSEEDINIINNYIDYINKIRYRIFAEHQEARVYVKDDFEIFLERNFTRQVNIPLTEYCIIKDAAIIFSKSGAFIESDLVIQNNQYLLILQMGASNVPHGEWSDYSSGAVQVLVNNPHQRWGLEGASKRGPLVVRDLRPAARRLPDTLRTSV
ncbi:MAG: hypothetical protein LBJ31_07880, partial [Treponema sp.]|nr:hypothetical protein [Treponema sp.]